MPKYDPAKDGFTQLFLNAAPQVTLPEQLTRKWWDKKKQLVAKTRATGMGDLLDELPGLLNALAFPRFPGNPAALDNAVQQMRSFMTSGELKKFRAKLKEIIDLAKSESTHFKKNALTKKTGEVLDEIENVADVIWVCLNQNSLSGMYQTAQEDYEKTMLDKAKKNAGPTLQTSKMVIKKSPAVRKKIREYLVTFQNDPNAKVKLQSGEVDARNAWGEALRTFCRDMTQPLGNLLKAHKADIAFIDFDAVEIEKLNKEMSKISNTKTHTDFADSCDGRKAEALTKIMEGWNDRYIDLIEDVELGAAVNS